MKRILIAISILLSMAASAQSRLQEITECPDKAGGVYYAYPVTESHNTPAPKGFRPFYVSHYGRHGSRYLISDNDYKWVIDRFHDAEGKGALTPLGRDVMQRLDSIWLEAEGRGGELTPLGARQHHDIASRMYKAYPEAFTDEATVTAASTQVMRCAHSMFAFIEGLKEHNPGLRIPRESSHRNMYYLCYHSPVSKEYTSDRGPWYQQYNNYLNENTRPSRLISSLFSDSTYVERWINPVEMMWGLYWIAVDMQNMETPLSFYDIFTPEELYDIWQVINFNFYAKDSAWPPLDGVSVDNAKNLLQNIIATADEYIAEGKTGATLRFGHDGNIIPLAALMQLPGAIAWVEDPHHVAEAWANYEISPMASNLQLIFFHDKKGDTLVKFMLNEQEVILPDTPVYQAPFHRWEDARETLLHFLDTPSRQFIPAVPGGCPEVV